MTETEIKQVGEAFAKLGDDPDYLAELVAREAGEQVAESLRDLFQAVGALLDAAEGNA